MFGAIMVALLAIAAYATGVHIAPVLIAIIIGTWIEYRWNRKHNKNASGSRWHVAFAGPSPCP